MKKLVVSIVVFACIGCLFTSCGKSGGGGNSGGGTTSTEEKLIVKLSAAAVELSTSTSLPFTVEVQSKMPTGGVVIKVDVKREDTNASVYSVQANSSAATTSFTISPLPSGQVYCLATITVTSATTSTNTWTGTFRVAAK